MPQLVFTSQDIEYVPTDRAALISALQQGGLIADRWQGERYLIGDAFLSLVTFMGCAPAIELQPLAQHPDSTDFCHIEFMPLHAQPVFMAGSDHLISRCPHCRQRHANWASIPASLTHACDKCGVASHLAEYDWKHEAGCGRFFIALHGIYPHEAIPTPGLLQLLQQHTGTEWNYFYMQDTKTG